MPEVKIALPSVVEAALFSSLIGIGLARRSIHLAENISAHIAREWELVENVVDDKAQLD